MPNLPTTGLTIKMIKDAIRETGTDNSAKNIFISTKVNPNSFNCPDTAMQSVIYGMDANTRKTLSPSDPGYIVRSGWEPGYHLGIFRGYIYDANKVYKFNTVYYDDFIDALYGLDYPIAVSFASNDPSESNWNPNPIPIHKYKVYMKRTAGGAWVGGPIYNHINYVFNGYVISNFFISKNNPIDYAVNGPLTSNETFYIKIEHISSPPGTWYNTPSEITNVFSYYYNEGTNTNHGQWYTLLAEELIFSNSNTITLPFKIFSESSNTIAQRITAYISKFSDFHEYYSQYVDITIPINTTNPGVLLHMEDNSIVCNFSYEEGDVIYYRFMYSDQTYPGQTIVPITSTGTNSGLIELSEIEVTSSLPHDNVFRYSIYADLATSTSITVDACVSMNSDFSNSSSFSGNHNIPANTTDTGTMKLVGNYSLEFSDNFDNKTNGSTVYYRIRYNTTEYITGSVIVANAPQVTYTNTKRIDNLDSIAIKQTSPIVMNDFRMFCDLYGDMEISTSVQLRAEMSPDSSFTQDVYAASVIIATIPQNTTPGTQSYVDTYVFDLSSTGIHQKVTVGNNVWCRFKMNNVVISTIGIICLSEPIL